MTVFKFEPEYFAKLSEVPVEYTKYMSSLKPYLGMTRIACPTCNINDRFTNGNACEFVPLDSMVWCPTCYGRAKVWCIQVPVEDNTEVQDV